MHARLTKLGATVPETERSGQVFGVGTRDAVARLQSRAGLTPTGIVDEATAAALATAASDADTPGRTVQGRVYMPYGDAGAGVTLRAYAKGFGGAATRLGEVKTDEHGYYALTYDTAAGQAVNLELRAVDAAGLETVLTEPVYAAGKAETLNVVAPDTAKPLGPEFTRLADDLKAKLNGDLTPLADAKEDDAHQDLSVLSVGTGWDAKLIALASTAVSLGKQTGLTVEAQYAALRAGLPATAAGFALVAPADLTRALKAVTDAKVAALSDADIATAAASLRAFGASARLSAKSPDAVNATGDFIAAAPLADAAAREAFTKLVADAPADAGGKLWADAAADPAIGPQATKTLRKQGKLAFLTQNNLALTQSLMNDVDDPDRLGGLVDKDLHTADAWTARLNALAGGDDTRLAKLIPPAYGGKAGLNAYAAEMARKVRLSFPRLVTAKTVRSADVPARERVADFIRDAEDFDLATTPANLHLKNHPALTALPEADRRATEAGVKRVQRVYQITPDDPSMKTMLDLGFDSAHAVMAFDYDGFMERFASKFPSRRDADLVYRRARQVAITTYGFLTTAKQLDNAPVLPGTSGDNDREQAKADLIRRFPTLESLFGSTDFCECVECRSVLSPAAYLVDLFKFLDPDDAKWKQSLADWPAAHNGEAYAADPRKPFDVLAARRPDLPNLALTCSNTNTVLPYIDVVNEILEAFVAGKLTAAATFDNGAATSAEMLAEPQTVENAAYQVLSGPTARYPLALPFDVWHETVRAFFAHFDVPLARTAELMRESDALFAAAGAPYGRAAVWFESLGLTPADVELLTAPQSHADWPTLYGLTRAADALPAAPAAGLRSAKALSRRLDIGYGDLVAVLRTAFVNPDLRALALLDKLGLEPADVFRDKKHPRYPPFGPDEADAFQARLDRLRQRYDFDARRWIDETWDRGAFDALLVLVDPEVGCDFEKTLLRRANGDSIDSFDLLRVNLFVRLWRKTGWTIRDVDLALSAFLPTDGGPLSEANIGPRLRSALVRMAHLQALTLRLSVGDDPRAKLLTLWTPLPTAGDNSLYAQLFLSATVLKNDAVFDDPLGRYLTADVPLADHLPALQGASGLTADEAAAVLRDSGQDVATAKLTVANASLLYRYGLLAKALKWPVKDLIVFKSVSGLDPFAPVGTAPLATTADDRLFGQTIAFLDAVDAFKASPFRVEDVDYLLRHRFDPQGKYRTAAETRWLRPLVDGINRINADYAEPADASEFSDEKIQQTLALALPAEVAATFFAMWGGTQQYAVSTPVPPADSLHSRDFAAEPAVSLDYDAVGEVQRLRVRGVLTDARRQALKTQFPSPLFGTLIDAASRQATDFFDDHLRQTVDRPAGGFLNGEAFELLFKPPATVAADATPAEQQAVRWNNDTLALLKRRTLARAFLPFLRDQLIERFVTQAVAMATGGDADSARMLLTDASLVTAPGGGTLLSALTAVAGNRMTANCLNDAGQPIVTDMKPTGVTTVGKPAGTRRVRFEGLLEVPADGPYRFFARLDKRNAAAELRVGDADTPLLTATAGVDRAEASAVTDLRAGVRYAFSFDVTALAGGDVRLLMQSESLPKGELDRLALYPKPAVVDRAIRAYTVLSKALRVATALALSPAEVRHVLMHRAAFDGVDWSKFPVVADDTAAASPSPLFTPLRRLLDYAALKNDLGLADDGLIDLFARARGTPPATPDALADTFAGLTRREPAVVRRAATRLKLSVADFAAENGLRRLWEVLKVVEALGVGPDSLAKWAVPSPAADVAADLRDTIKARDGANWPNVGRPIFDRLRQRKRDALVAYILHTQGFDRVEQLFEHFLIDPAIEPVVQTSRLRLAISSVQTFVQRCLLNLEPDVRPAALNAAHWEWMKRYRVWEANRKIFLYPENWLEPEFRDDKTFLYKELEGRLLQEDVNDEVVEEALIQYVQGLERIARLQMVSTYVQEVPGDPASNTLFVLGRTAGEPHEHFYRTHRHGAWTPWDKVDAEIDGEHMAVVMWRQRLYVFWVTFLEKPQTPNGTPAVKIAENATPGAIANVAANSEQRRELFAQVHCSHLVQGRWTPRQSSPMASLGVTMYKPVDPAQAFVHVRKMNDDGELHFCLRISDVWDSWPPPVDGFGGVPSGAFLSTVDRAFRVISPYAQPTVIAGEAPPTQAYTTGAPRMTRYTLTGSLDVTFKWETQNDNGTVTEQTGSKTLLPKAVGETELLFANPLTMGVPDFRAVSGAFFLQDERNTLFIEPSVAEQTITESETYAAPAPGPSRPLPWDTPIVPQVPPKPFPGGPRFPDIDPRAKIPLDDRTDWLINPGTALKFKDTLIGHNGRITRPVASGSDRVRSILATTVRPDLDVGPGPAVHVIDRNGLSERVLRNLRDSGVLSRRVDAIRLRDGLPG